MCLNLTRVKLVFVSWQGLSSFSTFNTLSWQTTLYRPVLHIANSVISDHLLQIRKITQMLLMEKLKRSQYVCLCFYFYFSSREDLICLSITRFTRTGCKMFPGPSLCRLFRTSGSEFKTSILLGLFSRSIFLLCAIYFT